MQTFQMSCMSSMLIGTIHFYHFRPPYTTFADLELGWLSQGQGKGKHLDFIFLHTFQPDRMKFDMVLEQSKLNILIGFLVRFNETVVLLAVLNQSKNKQIKKTF